MRGGAGHLGASRTQKHSEAGYGRPVDKGTWIAKTVKRTRQQPAQPEYANYWAPLMRKRHTMPHPAQPRHTNHWARRTRKRHQQEHRPQRPTESNDLAQQAKGRTGDCPGPRKETTTRRNVTQGGISCQVKFAVVKFAAGNFAEAPGFCVVNFTANLKHEISHTKLTPPEIPPALLYQPQHPPCRAHNTSANSNHSRCDVHRACYTQYGHHNGGLTWLHHFCLMGVPEAGVSWILLRGM